MDSAQSRPLSRIWLLALTGVASAFVWIVLSVVLGLAGDAARADDGSNGGTLLGGVSSVVQNVVEGATDAVTTTVPAVVTPVVQPVVEAVAPVTTPVTQAVAPVVQPVQQAVAPVAAPVQQAVQQGIVTPIVTPVVEIVTAVPVVGGVVEALGADEALTDVAATVDHTVGAVAELPAAVVAPVLPIVTGPTAPGTGPAVDVELSTGDAGYAASASAVSSAATASAVVALSPAADLPALFRAGATVVTTLVAAPVFATIGVLDASGGPAHSLLGGMSPLSAVSSGPGGAGLGAGALLGLCLFAAHRAWVRRNGLTDDEMPPAPAASTDVSPD